jgi:hypothetical protein
MIETRLWILAAFVALVILSCWYPRRPTVSL